MASTIQIGPSISRVLQLQVEPKSTTHVLYERSTWDVDILYETIGTHATSPQPEPPWTRLVSYQRLGMPTASPTGGYGGIVRPREARQSSPANYMPYPCL